MRIEDLDELELWLRSQPDQLRAFLDDFSDQTQQTSWLGPSGDHFREFVDGDLRLSLGELESALHAAADLVAEQVQQQREASSRPLQLRAAGSAMTQLTNGGI